MLCQRVCRFHQDLSYEERSKMLKDRLKKYSQKASPCLMPAAAAFLVSFCIYAFHSFEYRVMKFCMGARSHSLLPG